MSVQDVFKKSVLQAISTGDLSLKQAALLLIIACVFAAYIFVVYRLLTRKVFYNNNFNISLAAVTVIVAAIVIAIQSSLVVSLGMVGALSIVRFRTAIKEPLDLVFMFWGVSVGIICGAGMSGVAIIETLLLTVGILVLDALPVTKTPLLLVVHTEDKNARAAVLQAVETKTKHYQVKSQTMESEHLDMIIEIRMANSDGLMDAVSNVAGVTGCSLVRHDGETVF